jgi:hypothetical protein
MKKEFTFFETLVGRDPDTCNEKIQFPHISSIIIQPRQNASFYNVKSTYTAKHIHVNSKSNSFNLLTGI